MPSDPIQAGADAIRAEHQRILVEGKSVSKDERFRRYAEAVVRVIPSVCPTEQTDGTAAASHTPAGRIDAETGEWKGT